MNSKFLQEKRERFLRNLINEIVINVIAEQVEAMEAPVVQPPPPTVETTPPPVPDTTTPEFTVDTLVDKLNVLRGGKSLKDPEVYGKLTTFFNNLTEEQKTSTQWIMDELTKIVTDVGTGQPGTPPAAPTTAPAAPNPPAPAPAPVQPIEAPIGTV